MLDDRTGSPKRPAEHIGTLLWDARANAYGWRSFLGSEPGGPGVPARAVPARLQDMRGLAPAFIAVGGIDLFVDEDIDYERRLNAAGVPNEFYRSDERRVGEECVSTSRYRWSPSH